MKTAAQRLLSVMMAFTLMLTLAACGSGNNAEVKEEGSQSASSGNKAETKEPAHEPVTLSYMAVTSQLNYGGIKDLIANWEKQTGNKVDIQAIQDDQYDNLVKAKLAGGGDIDVFYGQYQKYDVPNQLLEISGEGFESRLNDVALQSMKYSDGKIYAFPSPAPLGTWGVFYNKKVFNDLGLTVPKTMDDLNKVLAAIKDKGINPLYFSAKDGWTMLQHRNAVNGIVSGADPAVWDKLNKNEVQWKDIPEFVYQYKQVEDWVKKGYINKDLATATYDQQQQALVDGKTAMVVHGSFIEAELLKKKPDADIGFFPLPNQDGSQKIALSGATQIFIAKNSKHPEEAKALLRYLSDKEQVQSYLEKSPGISAFKDVDVADKLSPAAKEIQELVNQGSIARHGDDAYVVPMPYDDLVAAYLELLIGRISADDFVKKHGDMYVKNGKIAKIPGF
ncbi:ABC transporter substrate-binding protein [Paenibacillus sp. SAF-054]|uniref:ABC transporter substrate-binding protein n=1 Tax=unclassified Paenibacillus TaxID=185978 RepID=UPI003F8128A0